MKGNIVKKVDTEEVFNDFESRSDNSWLARSEKTFNSCLARIAGQEHLISYDNIQYLKLFFREGVIFGLQESINTLRDKKNNDTER